MMNLSTTNDTINNSFHHSNELINSKPQLSMNLNTLNSNPIFLQKAEINYNSLPTPKSENLKLKLIEKDKTIFEYMKKEKEYIKTIENLKLLQKEKDEELIKFKEEIREFEIKLSKKENIINQKYEEFSLITDENKNLIKNLQKNNYDLNHKIIDLNNIIKAYENKKKINYEQNQKISGQIKDLISQIEKNEELLKSMKKYENELKEENKQIPSLKRKLADFENMIKTYQNQIKELKKNSIKNCNEKEELNNLINQKSEELKKEQISKQYVIRLNYKIDYLSNELNSKNIENENINNKYSLLKKDIDIFINLFIKDLNNYLNYLETLNIFSKNMYKLPLDNFPNFENLNINQEFRGKYDFLGDVINKIKQKIIDILNKNIEKNQNVLIDYNNKENKFKILLEEKDKILQNKNELENTLLNTNEQIQKYKIELKKFQKDYIKLKSDLLKMQDLNKDFILKNKALTRNFNDFIDDIKNQLKDFPYNNKVNKNNDKNKIIAQINSLIILNKELNNQIKNLEKENKGYKIELNQTIKDNQNLKNELHNNSKDLTDKIKIIKNENNNEFLEQKKMLYDKIHKLNDLLEESNQIIKTYEKETSELKNKNIKLENNIKLLTNSHYELEKIINSSTDGLKSEIDIKDQKYNDLLKELQLKDIHIKSLENLFDKQNRPDPGKIFSKINAIPLEVNSEKNNNNYEDQLNTTFNKDKNYNKFDQGRNEQDFQRDDITEMKLNKLINNFEIRNKINNFNNNQNPIEYNNNFIDNDFKNENIDEQNYILDENISK